MKKTDYKVICNRSNNPDIHVLEEKEELVDSVIVWQLPKRKESDVELTQLKARKNDGSVVALYYIDKDKVVH